MPINKNYIRYYLEYIEKHLNPINYYKKKKKENRTNARITSNSTIVATIRTLLLKVI